MTQPTIITLPCQCPECIIYAARKEPPINLSARVVIETAAATFGVSVSDMSGRTRHIDAVLARRVATQILHDHTIMSGPDIAEAYGKGRGAHATYNEQIRAFARSKDEVLIRPPWLANMTLGKVYNLVYARVLEREKLIRKQRERARIEGEIAAPPKMMNAAG